MVPTLGGSRAALSRHQQCLLPAHKRHNSLDQRYPLVHHEATLNGRRKKLAGLRPLCVCGQTKSHPLSGYCHGLSA
eukprot:4408511-Amphidinium_carterae.1